MHKITNMVLAIASCSALAAASFAQTDDARWYRVEVLIFAQPGGASEEQWPASPTLAYPRNWRFLVPQIHEDDKTYDAKGRQVIDERSTSTTDVTEDSAPAETRGNAIALPENYGLLPSASREFRGKAAYMQRNGGYRILFHEHWLQAFVEGTEPPAIIIDRSDSNSPWPELQGSVHLSLSRFLHLETNVWLNTDGSYLNASWQMPSPPTSPLSVFVIKDEQPAEATLEAPQADSMAVADTTLLLSQELDEEDPSATSLEPLYPYRHAVLMTQKRRMRSNEVHYIDHPMLGVVAKITPLDAEQLEAYAEAGRPAP